MYYAVKKVINYDPESLSKQHAEDYAALDGDTEYAEMVKKEQKANISSIICLGCSIIIPLAYLAVAAFAPSSHTVFPPLLHFATVIVFIPLALFIAFLFLSRLFKSQKIAAAKKKRAIFCNHVALASEYFDVVRDSRILACYGKVDDEDEDLFNLTIVTVPKMQPEVESEDTPSEYEIPFPFNSESLSLADRDNLVLDMGHEAMCFME